MAKKKLTLEDVLVPKEEIPYEVPENWCWVKLGSVCEIVTGNTPAKKNPEYYGDYIPFVKPADLDQGRNLTCSSESLSKVGSEKARIIPRNSTAVCCIGSIGKSAFLEVDVATNQQINCVIPKGVNSLYLYYYILSDDFQKQLWENSSATTISIINKTKMSNLNVCIPPLAEQERIVKRIESLFEKVDKARELVDEARDGFEKRRAAILEKAFSGELTDKWREENENTEIDKGIKEIEGFFEVPKNWKWIESKDIFIDVPRNGYSPKSTETPTPYKTLKLGAITKGYFDDRHIKYINEEIQTDSRLWLKNGDFLIQRSNSLDYVGTCAIYTGSDNEYIYPDLIMRAELDKNIIDSNWAVYYINSYYGRNYFVNNATGTAGNMPKINQKVVVSLPIPIPPIEEQKELVRLMNKLFEKEKSINRLTDLDELVDITKKSILAKAFRGELRSNNLDEESSMELLKTLI